MLVTSFGCFKSGLCGKESMILKQGASENNCVKKGKVTSIFSFSHNVFFPMNDKKHF